MILRAMLSTVLLFSAQEEPLKAGGPTALPPVRAAAVPLVNSGFEEAEQGWKFERSGAFTIAETEGAQGARCLRFAHKPGKTVPSVSQTIGGIKPGIYVLRFKVKTRGMEDAKGQTGGVRVQLQYVTEFGHAERGHSECFGGTSDWKDEDVMLLVHDDLKDNTLSINIHRYRSAEQGEAFLDGFSLERIIPPPVETYLLYPNYRGYLPANGPRTLRLWARVNDAAAPKIVVTSMATGKEMGAARSLPNRQWADVLEWDTSSWPEGGYSIQASAVDYAAPPTIVRKISAARQQRMGAWIDADQVLHLGGRPTFPLGFYNTAAEFSKVGEEDIARLDRMSEAPVNFQINYTWWMAPMETRRRYLGEMHKRGMGYLDTVIPIHPGRKADASRFESCRELVPALEGKIDTPERCSAYLTRLAEEMRKLPGHSGWYVMDERRFDSVPQVFAQYDVLRRADPDHPTFGVSNKPGEFFLWRDTLDVFGLDPYPLTNAALKKPLSMVGEYARAGQEATFGSRPVWIVVQYYKHFAKDHWPTREELRSMSLMAIVEGARGLFYWSYGMKGLSDVKNEKLREQYWASAVAVLKELKGLEPALLAPDTPGVVKSVSDPLIRWRARTAEGKFFVFAYRPAEQFGEQKDAPPVTVTLADGRQVSLSLAPDSADVVSVAAKP